MKILITGAAGFLGLHLTNYLHLQGHHLTLLDTAPFDPREYPNHAQSNELLNYVQGDVRDHAVMEPLIRANPLIIHAAAALPLWSKSEIFDTNVNGTKLMLEYALRKEVQHFVYISSTAVYGVPKVHPIYEDAPLIGVGAYGESKVQAEQLCKDYRDKGLAVTVLRPKTFIGTHRLGVFEILYDWIHDGKKIPVIGSGNNKYQLFDVDDLVEYIHLIINSNDKKRLNDAFNVGAAEFHTVKEDLGALFDYAQSGSNILPTPALPVKATLWVFEKLGVSPLYQWIYDTADKDSYASIDKITNVLNFTPKYSNAQALIKSYQWYIDNYDAIKSRPEGINHTSGWKQGILRTIKKFM
jgi:nucleoside-diphosphate-sugar epimerase